MKQYSKKDSYQLYQGSMLDMAEVIANESIDSIITDPPYELGFMGKSWDNSGIAFNKDAWLKCYNALKPGGYLLAFGGSRTYHRIACAIEDAGFEIRDCIMWLYGSGFPKSHNIGLNIDKKMGVESKVVGEIKAHNFSKHNGSMMSFATTNENKTSIPKIEIKQAQNEWQGWGTALKPAYEPIIMARKPFKGTVVDNVLKNGVGGINIDECRVETNINDKYDIEQRGVSKAKGIQDDDTFLDAIHGKDMKHGVVDKGRFPANVIHDGSEEAISGFPNTKSSVEIPNTNHSFKGNKEAFQYGYKVRKGGSSYDDEGSASRYFYCAKSSKKDRDEGLKLFDEKLVTDGCIRENSHTAGAYGANMAIKKNIHPTVKPVDLMQYLVRLVSPKGATILDCFMGSGSTGKAVMFENRERDANYKFIGIELTEEYLPICDARIDYALNKYEYDIEQERQENKEKGILDIFDYMEEK